MSTNRKPLPKEVFETKILVYFDTQKQFPMKENPVGLSIFRVGKFIDAA